MVVPDPGQRLAPCSQAPLRGAPPGRRRFGAASTRARWRAATPRTAPGRWRPSLRRRGHRRSGSGRACRPGRVRDSRAHPVIGSNVTRTPDDVTSPRTRQPLHLSLSSCRPSRARLPMSHKRTLPDIRLDAFVLSEAAFGSCDVLWSGPLPVNVRNYFTERDFPEVAPPGSGPSPNSRGTNGAGSPKGERSGSRFWRRARAERHRCWRPASAPAEVSPAFPNTNSPMRQRTFYLAPPRRASAGGTKATPSVVGANDSDRLPRWIRHIFAEVRDVEAAAPRRRIGASGNVENHIAGHRRARRSRSSIGTSSDQRRSRVEVFAVAVAAANASGGKRRGRAAVAGRGNTNVWAVADPRHVGGAKPARAARRVPPPIGARPLVASTRAKAAGSPASQPAVKGGLCHGRSLGRHLLRDLLLLGRTEIDLAAARQFDRAQAAVQRSRQLPDPPVSGAGRDLRFP